MEKVENAVSHRIYDPQIKQIAGRAGRYRVAGVPEGHNPGGLVTTFSPSDQKYLRAGIESPNPILQKAYLWPPFRVFEKFCQQFPVGVPLASLLSQFSLSAQSLPHYDIVSSEDKIALAQVIEEETTIDFETRYNVTFAPIKTQNNQEVVLFKRCGKLLALGKPVTIENHVLDLPFHIVGKEQKMTKSKLHSLEMLHKMIMSYCWLAYLPSLRIP